MHEGHLTFSNFMLDQSAMLLSGPTRDYIDIRPDILPGNSMVGVEICSRSRGYMLKFCRILAQAGILWLKRLCVRADCRSPQEDRPVNDRVSLSRRAARRVSRRAAARL